MLVERRARRKKNGNVSNSVNNGEKKKRKKFFFFLYETTVMESVLHNDKRKLRSTTETGRHKQQIQFVLVNSITSNDKNQCWNALN